MRLLEYLPDDRFAVTGNLTENEDIEYAILSHTWGSEEVTFKDLINSTGGDKDGYKKLRFCANRARYNGLRYFWVDTCCIDKSNQVELNEAIISMFRWYKNAARCYIYLSDVLSKKRKRKRMQAEPWEEAFRVSRWFTRGWTLQELLAPLSVEFFTLDGKRLGDKRSLEQPIHETTKIALSALRGTNLSQFDISERFKWAESRETTREEDWVYYQLGIFGISIPALYGEGRENAIRRLKREINPGPQNCHYIPLPKNGRFLGQDSILDDLRQKLFHKTQTRTVAVIRLGGVGKTQVALQVAYWAKRNRPEYSVLWVPALSDASFEQAYMEIAKTLGIRRADDEDIRDTVRQYLSSNKAGHWFLVVDNADDKDVLFGYDTRCGIIGHLPYSDQGLILFTTRFEEIAEEVAGSDMIELGDMDQQEATELLGRHLRRKEQVLSDEASTAELLRELAHLPLAITQAAAYINRNHISLSEYLRLLRGSEQDIIGIISREFQDSSRYRGIGNAVATTWLISFDQIRKSDAAACNMLMFISRIEPKAIPRSLLPRMGSEEEMVQAIGTLCAYSFLIRRSEGVVYDMHRLVHLATQIWMGKHRLMEEATEKAMRHVVEVFPSDAYENRYLWREYMPHALKLVRGNVECNIVEQYELYFWAGRCLQADGRIREAVECLEKCDSWRREHFAEDHPSRLASQHNLAGAYQANGQVDKAVALLEHVVRVHTQKLAEDHPSRLTSQDNLARAYQANGQVDKAVALLEHVVRVRTQKLAEDHPSRLASQHNLAGAYQANGQVDKAVALLEHVVRVEEKLAEDHRSRLASQDNLAYILRERDSEARNAQE